MKRLVHGLQSTPVQVGRWSSIVCLLAMLVVCPAASQANSSAPGETRASTTAVQRTMRELLYILRELHEAGRSTQLRWEVEQVVRRSFDYEMMAQRSLGEAWAGLTPVERRQYVRQYVQLLRDEVADRLREYSPTQMTYVSDEGDEETRRVVIAPAGPTVETRIEFHVARRSETWVLHDVVFDGVGMVSKYQAQFSRILREGSFSELMERMKQNALVATLSERAAS